jgi:5-methylcytosine-specific restriction endonuclease McrA
MLKGQKGKKHSEESRKRITGCGNSFWGKHHTEEARKKIALYQKNKEQKPVSEETRLKLSLALRGKNSWNKGKHHSPETKQKMREKKLGCKNKNWLGGITFNPYGEDWTRTLKISIRERDNYTCQMCGKLQCQLIGRMKLLAIHHIDYDKHNCDPKNLITLCNNCHIKTNTKRDYWLKFFATPRCR